MKNSKNRNVVILQKGKLSEKEINHTTLSVWMVNNELANVVTDSYTVGNVLPETLDRILALENVALIVTNNAVQNIKDYIIPIDWDSLTIVSHRDCKRLYEKRYPRNHALSN